MTPTVYYCYDAWCGWCYGFSPVIRKLYENYRQRVAFDVLSGGMILNDPPAHVGAMAGYIVGAYQTVENHTGIRFGEDYLWHMRNPEQSDWFPHSLKPAIALCVFKHYFPERVVEWASDLSYALHYEGRDLTDDEAYRHLLYKYEIPAEAFYEQLHSEAMKEQAQYEFALVKQLQVSGYPSVLVQVSDSRFYLIARGFLDYELLRGNLERVLEESDHPEES